MNPIAKMLTSVATSTTKSLIGTGIKKTVNDLIKRYTAKKPEQIEKEVIEKLGYASAHYKLGKNQEVIFRPSSVFMHEWMMNAPEMKDKIIKDEEAGTNYYCGELLSNTAKVKIINDFMKATGAQSPSLSGHFDQAMKLWEPTDHIGEKFKKHFSGWKEGTPSVIDTWMEKCFGGALSSDPAYSRMIFRRWIVGTAKRIVEPGSPLDGVLVLQGAVDVGKTQHFRQLLGEPFANRTGEIYADVRSPNKMMESLLGKSVASMDELAVLLESQTTVEVLKYLCTAQHIDVRLAWAREVRRFKMRCGLGATTNREKFITDAGLSRRLWIISLNNSRRLDFDYLTKHRDDLWAEAIWLAQNGGTSILTPEERMQVEKENEKFMV